MAYGGKSNRRNFMAGLTIVMVRFPKCCPSIRSPQVVCQPEVAAKTLSTINVSADLNPQLSEEHSKETRV
jgi:hypothetical protein